MGEGSGWLDDARELSNGVQPVSDGDIAEAERLVGLALPEVLKEAYRQLGTMPNGPQIMTDRLLHPLEGVRRYLRHRSEGDAWEWPEGVVPIVDWGCGIEACILLTSPIAEVWWFDPNLDGVGGGYRPPWGTASGFTDWIVRFATRDPRHWPQPPHP